MRPVVILALAATCIAGRPAAGLDIITFQSGDQQQTVEGCIVAEAEDGRLLLMAPDGHAWSVEAAQLVSRESDARPFEPLTRQDAGPRVRAEIGGRFDLLTTQHYVVLYSTDREYAQWVVRLLERLYRAFTVYWQHRDFELVEPAFPLVAVVFRDRESYAEYARQEVGEIGDVVGYYSFATNRVALYDISREGTGGRWMDELNVATIIHEATHQIAFNCGLHRRYADNPLWLAEGMALYFETPDLESDEGWRTMGEVNRPRLAQFADYLERRRRSDSFETLVADDARFRDPRTAADAYAEAWALNYFLLMTRGAQYHAYLRVLNGKQPLAVDGPERRIAEFEAAFGPTAPLDRQFVLYMRRLLRDEGFE